MLENSFTLCLSLMHIFDPRFTMHIAPSNSSWCQSNVREGSNARDGDGDMASMGGASGIAARIKQRSNKRGCLSLSAQAQVINNHEAHDQENQDQRPNREEEDNGLTEDVGDENLHEHGPALMPEVPREEDKVVLTPLGDR
jgi:hypothetical protein